MWARRRGEETPQSVLVIGLGRFGHAVASSLVEMGKEVLAIDLNPDTVQRCADEFTHVVQADATDEQALAQLEVRDFDRAVVAIGTEIESSVLTVLALSELGVKEIWAKAISVRHGEILARIGAHHVIHPEREMGEKVAHMIVTFVRDYIEFDGYALARIQAPDATWDVPLGESALGEKYQVTVVGVKRPAQPYTYAQPSTVIRRGDELLVTGAIQDVEMFAQVARTAGPAQT